MPAFRFKLNTNIMRFGKIAAMLTVALLITVSTIQAQTIYKVTRPIYAQVKIVTTHYTGTYVEHHKVLIAYEKILVVVSGNRGCPSSAPRTTNTTQTAQRTVPVDKSTIAQTNEPARQLADNDAPAPGGWGYQ
jgi:hypothetical protein